MKKKILILSLSLCSVLVVVLTIIGVIQLNKYSFINENEDLIFNINDNDTLKLNKKVLSTEDGYEYVVEAYFYPQVASKIGVDWSLDWADSSITEDVSEYVSKISNNDYSVTIKYLKQFSNQIILTATYSYDSSITATCTIDCYERPVDFNIGDLPVTVLQETKYLNITDNNDGSKNINFSSLNEVNFDEVTFGKWNPTADYYGSVKLSNSISGVIELSDEIKQLFNSKNIEYEEKTLMLSDLEGYTLKSLLCYFVTGLADSSSDDFSMLLNQINESLSSTAAWFTLNVYLMGSVDGSSPVYEQNYVFKFVGFNIDHYLYVDSIELSYTEIIF